MAFFFCACGYMAFNPVTALPLASSADEYVYLLLDVEVRELFQECNIVAHATYLEIQS
jgi:hypothetical protein